MADPLGLKTTPTGFYSSALDKPILRQKILKKLNEIQQEAGHVQSATRQLDASIRSNSKAGVVAAENAKTQLRNWALSLVESIGYIERVIGIGQGANGMSDILQLTNKAVRLGYDRGFADEKL